MKISTYLSADRLVVLAEDGSIAELEEMLTKIVGILDGK
jgi:hypothetical protein